MKFEMLIPCGYADLPTRRGKCLGDQLPSELTNYRGYKLCANCLLSVRLNQTAYDISTAEAYGRHHLAVDWKATLRDRLETLGKDKVYDIGCQHLWKKYVDGE
jgi:hypothetical protein